MKLKQLLIIGLFFTGSVFATLPHYEYKLFVGKSSNYKCGGHCVDMHTTEQINAIVKDEWEIISITPRTNSSDSKYQFPGTFINILARKIKSAAFQNSKKQTAIEDYIKYLHEITSNTALAMTIAQGEAERYSINNFNRKILSMWQLKYGGMLSESESQKVIKMIRMIATNYSKRQTRKNKNPYHTIKQEEVDLNTSNALKLQTEEEDIEFCKNYKTSYGNLATRIADAMTKSVCDTILLKVHQPLPKEKVLLDTCKKSMNGKMNFKTPESGLIDCLTKTDAIAYEYAKNWQKAVGKALYYGSQTDRKAGIVLICKTIEECKKSASKIQDIAIQYDTPITVWDVVEK